MPDKKIIAVIGATGAQGGGVVRAIQADKSGSFAARAITRNPDSEKAQALRAAGAEVVAADTDKPETLGKAFAGAYGAFCVTNFWEHFSPERELTQARNHGAGGESRRRAACDLVHPRGHPQVGAARGRPDADARWASTRCRTSTPRARPIRSSATSACPPRSC